MLGAGGGVGLAAVALGHHLGATVTAVASSVEKLDVARGAGATRLVRHTGTDLRLALKEVLPGGADVVVDPVGGDLSEPALRSLRWGGRFVTVGYASGVIPRIPLNLVLLKGCEVLGFQFREFAGHRGAELAANDDDLWGLLAAGTVSPHIGAVRPLDDVAAALSLVSDGRIVGKVVLDVGGEPPGAVNGPSGGPRTGVRPPHRPVAPQARARMPDRRQFLDRLLSPGVVAFRTASDERESVLVASASLNRN